MPAVFCRLTMSQFVKKSGSSVAKLPNPEIQTNLEKDFPDSPLLPIYNKFDKGNLSVDEYERRRQLYLVYLIAVDCYESYIGSGHGILRSQMSKVLHEDMRQKMQEQETKGRKETIINFESQQKHEPLKGKKLQTK